MYFVIIISEWLLVWNEFFAVAHSQSKCFAVGADRCNNVGKHAQISCNEPRKYLKGFGNDGGIHFIFSDE